MTGDEILKLAVELFASNRPKSEALCRAIVGRSYYAAYHLSLELLADLGLPRSNDHKIPARWLIESGEPGARRAGHLLEDLYSARRRADYDLGLPRAIAESRDLQFVKSQIEIATDIKSLLAVCAVEPARSLVLAGIQSYRQRIGGQPGGR